MALREVEFSTNPRTSVMLAGFSGTETGRSFGVDA